MRWGANKVCVFATCGKCGLRSAVHWTIKKTESSAASHSNGPEEAQSASGEPRSSECSTPQEPRTPPPPPAQKKAGIMMHASEEQKTSGVIRLNDTYSVSLPTGPCMIDSGAKKSVGGPTWHRQFQQAVRAAGWDYSEVPQPQVFKFGPGPPIQSEKYTLHGGGGRAPYERDDRVGTTRGTRLAWRGSPQSMDGQGRVWTGETVNPRQQTSPRYLQHLGTSMLEPPPVPR